jgi:tRNA-splicing ligase RtcB
MQPGYELLHAEGGPTPIKGWVRGVPLEDAAHQQLRNIASIPFVGPWVAVMPDVHLGRGATVGSVIPTRGAVIPAAVGVDIGCGMAAVRTTLRAADLPDSLAQLRTSIERSVPVGNGPGGDHRKLPDSVASKVAESGLVQRLAAIKAKHRGIRVDKLDRQLGTLGGGNHFIELCLDEADAVWVMLHSGSRGTGNLIGSYFIARANSWRTACWDSTCRTRSWRSSCRASRCSTITSRRCHGRRTMPVRTARS